MFYKENNKLFNIVEKALAQPMPLIEPELFNKGSLILPAQVNPMDHECNLKYVIAATLEKNGQVWTEAKFKEISKKPIDVLARLKDEDENSFQIAIEVKKEAGEFNEKIKERFLELRKIKEINLLYCAAFSKMSSPQMRKYENEHTFYLQNIKSYTDFIYENSLESGVLFYHPLGKIDIEKHPRNINLENELTYKHELNEERIKYMLWKYFKNKKYIVATESKLPSISEFQKRRDAKVARKHIILYDKIDSKIPRLDLTIMNKKFVNKLNPIIEGIEVKHNFLDKTKIIKNLKRYAESRDISKLYLACHESKINEAKEILYSSGLRYKIGLYVIYTDGNEISAIDESIYAEELFELNRQQMELVRFKKYGEWDIIPA